MPILTHVTFFTSLHRGAKKSDVVKFAPSGIRCSADPTDEHVEVKQLYEVSFRSVI